MRYSLILCLVLSCTRPTSGDDSSQLRPTEEPISERIELKFSKGFKITKYTDYKEITILDLNNKSNVVQIILVGKGARDMEGYIPTPVVSAACNSTTHVSYFSKLGSADKLIGVSWPELIMNKEVLKRIENGSIQAIGANGEMNLEVILKMAPEILMVYPYESLNYRQYEDAGIQLVYNTEYQETHPLAKAEWIKLYGILFGKEKEAYELFDHIENEYLKNKIVAENLAKEHGSPSVFTGSFLNGQWFAPAAESSTVRSLKDAGANYVFENEGNIGNIQLDFEVMFQKCSNADFYGKLVSEAIDLKDMQDQEQRLGSIKAVREGKVFYCNTSTADYFGDALLEPHLILEDLIHIFYGEHLENEIEPHYFQMMGPLNE